ncbi:MAG TPA: MFS transporter [Burkholderiaceae bacterium]|nr:MFS transporter [Burkholderiaceae bacterium]
MTARASINALAFGNFALGSGVLIVAGMLSELADGLQVSLPVAGWLVAAAAIVIGVGAPVMATLTSRIDRRRLLVAALAWYALGLGVSALVSDFETLLVVRVLTVISAGIFTPQAAATAALLVPPAERGRALATTFLGWSIASVIGLPLGAWIAGEFGWRVTFAFSAALAALGAAAIYFTVPRGLKAEALNLHSWRLVLRDPVLPLVLLVTVVQASGQFIAFAYIAPLLAYAANADTTLRALLLAWCGVFGVLGNIWVARRIDRMGPDRTALIMLTLTATGIMVLGLAHGATWVAALALLIWGAGIFGLNSSQQARLVVAAPPLAGASIALNTTGMFLGQAIGASAGGAVLSGVGISALPWFAVTSVLAAMVLSQLAASRSRLRAVVNTA